MKNFNMSSITSYSVICVMVLCSMQNTIALSYEASHEYLKKTVVLIKEHQTPLLIASASAVAASIIAYGIYLDGLINNKDSLWHWSIHHIKDGIIDQASLTEYIQEHYPELELLHPLTAIFATAHAAQAEIELCLTLQAYLPALRLFVLTGC